MRQGGELSLQIILGETEVFHHLLPRCPSFGFDKGVDSGFHLRQFGGAGYSAALPSVGFNVGCPGITLLKRQANVHQAIIAHYLILVDIALLFSQLATTSAAIHRLPPLATLWLWP